MFICKWVAASGSQALYNANEIHYTPPGGAQDGGASVTFEDADRNASVTIGDGRVYVMNEAGTTIDRYVLKGDREFPDGLLPVR